MLSSSVLTLTPVLLTLLNTQWSLPPFSPRQLIYTYQISPLFLAPFSFQPASNNTTLKLTLSRLLQAGALWKLTRSTSRQHYSVSASISLRELYLLWFPIAFGRTALGWILSRSVGWAYPHLFKHWALYEVSAGFGPSLVAYIHSQPTLNWGDVHVGVRVKGREVWVSLLLVAVLSFLEEAPWTYAVAVCVGVVYFVFSSLAIRLGWVGSEDGNYKERLPVSTANRDTSASSSPPPHFTNLSTRLRFYQTLKLAFLALLSISSPHIISTFLLPSPKFAVPMPLAPYPPHPLLDILILTFPRPDREGSETFLRRTVESYLPYAKKDSGVSISVFTHSSANSRKGGFAAFDDAQRYFASLADDTEGGGANANVTFYVDDDVERHDSNSEVQGQYLHMGEAFRWETERAEKDRAEWVMLVEDDFPICGDAGWEGVKRVMRVLEGGRDGEVVERRGGFVGTGGSGLIIHKSLLPILVHILRTYAHTAATSPLPAYASVRPPDVVVQDCLLGKDPLCPRRRGGGESGEGTLVITSRLVMDHIGGMASTTVGKKGNRDKWRCGWRHAFHGMLEVEVVEV